MNSAGTAHRAAPFRKRTVLAMVVFGFAAFLALLYFIGAGETQRQSNDGGSHAASNGLNGFAGLSRLLEIEGYDVSVSRTQGAFDTENLLILTPPLNADVEDIQSILDQRYYSGPTLLILPKWAASRITDNPTDDVEVGDGWVRLLWSSKPKWIEELDAPVALEVEELWRDELEQKADEDPDASGALAGIIPTAGDDLDLPEIGWSGFGLSGTLPDGRANSGIATPAHETLVQDSNGDVLASYVLGEEDSSFYEEAYPVVIVVDPDLVNNYGLANEANAALALKLVEEANRGYYAGITFDVTLNGLGGSDNLLTLAFRPPFLAATICLILALLIVGWRAFVRFGPALAEGQAIAFGKKRLVTNGAGLILRARRLKLLAEPYIALMTRRIGARLGIARPDGAQVEAALARRMPSEPGLHERAEALRNARRPKEILRAARALKELERKLEK